MAIILKPENIAQLVFFVRGEKVMFDADLARLYGVSTKALNQAMSRNRLRFPDDFAFRLSADEFANLRSQIATASGKSLAIRSQTVTASKRNIRYLPYAFTEQGVAMLSSVLRSQRAVEVNIAIMRTFVRLREMLLSNADLARKLADLESKYDAQFKVVFDAIRELMLPPDPPKPRIGFKP